MARSGRGKGTKGIVREVVPPTFPHGTQRISTDGGVQPGGTGLYGKRVGGRPPINAARVRRGRGRG